MYTKTPPHRIAWPLTSTQVEQIDTMLEQLYKRSGSGTGDGIPGPPGADGAPGSNGSNGTDGAPGIDGIDGSDGTPVDVMSAGYWSPLIDVDPITGPELVFAMDDTIAVWTPTP